MLFDPFLSDRGEQNMMLHCGNVWKSIISGVESQVKGWTKPATTELMTGLVSDLTRSKADLLVENALLRQQLIVLERQVKRPQFSDADRLRLVLLSSCTKYWKQALHIVQPDTVLRWHREMFRRYWRKKSKGMEKKPKVEADMIELIRQMARENPFWGAERIRGEMLKLGTKVSKRTVQKYMVRARKSRSPGQNWATFLKNHASETWACDFTTAYDWLFRPYHIFIIFELKTRRIIHWAVTAHVFRQCV
jgi:putative transposase